MSKENTKKGALRRALRNIPGFAAVMFVLLFVSLILFLCALLSPAAADFLNLWVSRPVRRLLGTLTSCFTGFSFAEILLMLLPVWLFLLVFFAVRAYKKKYRLRYLFTLCGIVSYFAATFLLTLGIGYHTSPLDRRIGLTDTPVSAEELEKTAKLLQREVNALAGTLETNEAGSSLCPYSLPELSTRICAAYDRVAEKYPFLDGFYTVAKPVQMDETMTYAHLLGMYTYFTGESNVNTNYPDYNLPFTVAHEFAHQRGVSRENEANFIAFAVCIASDDTYIRYSGYLNMYEYTCSALARADRDRYTAIAKQLDPAVRRELLAYAEFHEKYENNTLGTISERVNDIYLKNNGAVEGTRSYGLVVDLCVAYYRETGWQ